MDEETIKRLQAKAMADLHKDIAKAEAKNIQDPVRNERMVFTIELVRARLAKKLSQAELAAQIGTQQSVISRIESGKGNPSLTTLLKIARALDANLVLN